MVGWTRACLTPYLCPSKQVLLLHSPSDLPADPQPPLSFKTLLKTSDLAVELKNELVVLAPRSCWAGAVPR